MKTCNINTTTDVRGVIIAIIEELEYLLFHASHSFQKHDELITYARGMNLCSNYLKDKISLEYFCEQFNCDSYRNYLYMLKPYLAYDLIVLYKLY